MFSGPVGTGGYMAAACVDVTERKLNEAEIARVRDGALAASRAKDEFLAALSHELRTPLNPVLLTARDAATRPEFPAAAREAFAMIAKNARLEARLIDDLLDLTRSAQGRISLDIERIDVPTVLREATIDAAGPKWRILLVEDHQPTRVTLERLLTRRGYAVSSAETAAEARRLAAEQKFDLVVSDIGLPDTDGFSLMELLRERYRLRGIALTGYGMEEDVARSRAAGYVAHLTKPVDIQKLEAVLARLQSEAPNP